MITMKNLPLRTSDHPRPRLPDRPPRPRRHRARRALAIPAGGDRSATAPPDRGAQRRHGPSASPPPAPADPTAPSRAHPPNPEPEEREPMTTLTPFPAASATSGFDLHGNRMTGTPDDVAAYDRAIDRLLRFDVEVLVSLERADDRARRCAHDPRVRRLPLPHLDRHRDARRRPGVRRRARHPRPERARGGPRHRHPATGWPASGTPPPVRSTTSSSAGRPTCWRSPVGQQLDFAVGDPLNMRDRVGRSLGALGEGHPHHPFVLGMHAFGLEECGTYDAAEEAGMAALAAHPDDVWAVHAVAHVHEMRGDTERGRRLPHVAGPSDWGERQRLRRAPLVAPGAVPAGARPHRRRARHLRHPGAPRRLAGRAARDARRQRPALAAAPRRRRRRHPLRRARRRLVDPDRGRPLVRVQRRARHHGAGRRRPHRRRPSPWSTGWPGRSPTGRAPRRTAP